MGALAGASAPLADVVPAPLVSLDHTVAWPPRAHARASGLAGDEPAGGGVVVSVDFILIPRFFIF
jgi:hypothetical protein